MTMYTQTAKQKKIMKNFREAQKLRAAREKREAEAEQRRVSRLEHDNRQLRNRPQVVPFKAPDGFMERVLEHMGHMAARDSYEPLLRMFQSEPWSAAIPMAAESIWNGSAYFRRVSMDRTIDMEIMEHLFDGNYRFNVHIPAIDISYVIDRYELQHGRDFLHAPSSSDVPRAEYVRSR